MQTSVVVSRKACWNRVTSHSVICYRNKTNVVLTRQVKEGQSCVQVGDVLNGETVANRMVSMRRKVKVAAEK